MAKFVYVYILQSQRDEHRFYTGLTDDLRKGLTNHNAGRIRYTLKWRPWRLKTYVAPSERVRAADFERYLKSASGRAFVKRHFGLETLCLLSILVPLLTFDLRVPIADLRF